MHKCYDESANNKNKCVYAFPFFGGGVMLCGVEVLCPGTSVFTYDFLFVSWFVSRITQKLLH